MKSKGGEFLKDPEKSFTGFIRWASERIEKKIDKLKSEKGKMRAFKQGEEKLMAFQEKREDILNLFKVSRLLYEAKNIFISKYNSAVYNTKHFVDDGSGDLVATNPEGYVAVDHAGNGVKFVDRLEFSRANFAMDKGFSKNESRELEIFWGTSGFSTKKTLVEWAAELPKPRQPRRDLFEKLHSGIPITSLVHEAKEVKHAIADAVSWGLAEASRKKKDKMKLPTELISNVDFSLNEQTEKRLIAIYPGRFQPMGRHHFQTYQKLAQKFGLKNTFIATSDKTGPKSPLSFDEKKLIMTKHGVPPEQIVMTRSPYQATEVTSQFDPETTAVVFAVGKKDMEESPRFANLGGLTKKGAPAYYKRFDPSEELEGLDRHGYIDVAPHVSIDIPAVGEMCGTSLRQCLGNASPEQFEAIMGWFDQEIYDLLTQRLEELSGAGGVGPGLQGFPGAVGRTREPDVVGSEKKKKKQHESFLPEEDQLVNEVMHYLLGITVG